MPNINTILFDLGHVVYDIDFDLTIQAFDKIGIPDVHLSPDGNREIFNQLETGRISPRHFITYFVSQYHVDPQALVDAWNAMLIGVPKARMDLLKALAQEYELFVYSNTNHFHVKEIHHHLRDQHNMVDWWPTPFTDVFYSHEIGHRKPDSGGFLFIIEQAGLDPSITLFIDDHLTNIRTAQNCGFRVAHKRPQDDLMTILKRNGII